MYSSICCSTYLANVHIKAYIYKLYTNILSINTLVINTLIINVYLLIALINVIVNFAYI